MVSLCLTAQKKFDDFTRGFAVSHLCFQDLPQNKLQHKTNIS